MEHPCNYINLVGNSFGNLKVIKRNGQDKYGQAMWLCLCCCGIYIITRGYLLRSGKTKSCGCLNRDINRKRKLTHGESKTRLYRVWAGMIQRCQNKNTNSYKNYGGRGISVCVEWKQNYINFRDWAKASGYKKGLSIDRINNDGNYTAKNCRWASRSEQMKNRRPTHLNRKRDKFGCFK